MRFTKMHGLGNDYIYVNAMTEEVSCPSEMARVLSDRHFGIGADGLILLHESKVADVRMEMYNADGTQGMMCGNGVRCIAKYVYDKEIVRKEIITVETLSGIKETKIFTGTEETLVEVNMGNPLVYERGVLVPLDGKEYVVDYISMGNPHAVVREEDLKGLKVEELGPQLEYYPAFRERVNVEFAHVTDRRTVEMRVWERGSGETFACGTGACAAAVSSALNNLTEREVTIKLIGGDLLVKWSREDGNVYMTGPAVTVFEGEINL